MYSVPAGRHIYKNSVTVKVPLQKSVGCDPCGRPNKRKQHDKQKLAVARALNIIGAGRPQGSHPTKNTYKTYFIFYIDDNQMIILSKIIAINLQRNFYSNKIVLTK